LLFGASDVVKQTRFIDEKPDPHEQQVARAQLQQMVRYAECSNCRRSELLGYFGEEFQADGCGACDNCLSPRATFDGTLAALKFLSCVYRIREKNSFGVGLNHVVEVLTGADTEKIRKWNHAELSTYGIGTEHGRAEWSAIGRELVRLGLLRQPAEKFSVLELTDEGRAALKERRKITLTKPVAAPETEVHHVGEIACDEILFERLRELRKKLADERDLPAYIIFSDVALRQMARNYPADESSFARISGVGEKKLREFGNYFLAEIAAHLENHPRQIFADDSLAAPSNPKNSRTTEPSTSRCLNACAGCARRWPSSVAFRPSSFCMTPRCARWRASIRPANHSSPKSAMSARKKRGILDRCCSLKLPTICEPIPAGIFDWGGKISSPVYGSKSNSLFERPNFIFGECL
jgi:RQC domain/HRDC domain/RecQ zinc-binding